MPPHPHLTLPPLCPPVPDDDLPEYILVLIRHGRAKDNIANDLEYFLSAQTAEFANWYGA